MIFIGAELSDPNAHFVTNIVDSIGSQNDLLIDLMQLSSSNEVFLQIEQHLQKKYEQYVIYNAYENEDFFFKLQTKFPSLKLITVFSDDEWRHGNYDRYLALYSNLITVSDIGNIHRYQDYGIDVIYMPWACNPKKFHPVVSSDKLIDVSFIGAAYGQRIEYIRYLINEGVNLRVYGKGWEYFTDLKRYWGGFLSHKQLLEVVSSSKINLNFLWTSEDAALTVIKGRVMELAACKAFQLTNNALDLANNGFVDNENIAIFNDKEDLLEKIRFYLKHGNLRKEIAKNSYELVLNKHTWSDRFSQVFDDVSVKNYKDRLNHTYHILVIAKSNIEHNIKTNYKGISISFVESVGSVSTDNQPYDGVIRLEHDTSISSDSLYMMVFGLTEDKSDIVVSNFYANNNHSSESYWIRFRENLRLKNKVSLSILPTECFMFSRSYISEHGFNIDFESDDLKVSFIEYPSYTIHLPYITARLLRLYFANYGDSRKKLKQYLKDRSYIKAFNLMIDKMWQVYCR